MNILNCGRAVFFSIFLIFSYIQYSFAIYSISLQPPFYKKENLRRRKYKRKFGKEYIAVVKKYYKYILNTLISENIFSINYSEDPVIINDLFNKLFIRIVFYILLNDGFYKWKKFFFF
jgi:hypothetical protein